MALAETAEMAVRLSLDDRLSPGIDKINRRLGAFSGAVNRNLARGIDAGLSRVIRGGFSALNAGIESLKRSEVVQAQTAAVLKSTGNAAHVTAQQVSDLANKYEDLNATIDDKVIQSAENVLLTFTKVNQKAFEPALQAALDLNQAMGGGESGLQGTIVQLGKALNDPIKGLTSLQRVGVTFSAQQKKQIGDLIKHNDLLGAQQIILGELSKEFGGSFARAGNTAAGAQARLADKVEDLQRAFASALLPVITKVADRISAFVAKPETIRFFEDLSQTIASIFTDENLDTAASAIQTAATAVKTAISAFNQLPPEIKALAIGAFAINKVTGGAVTGAAGLLGKLLGAGLQKIFAANVTVIGTNVTAAGAGAAGAATGATSTATTAAAAGTSKLSKFGQVLNDALKVVIVAEVADAIQPTLHQVSSDLHDQFFSGITLTPNDLEWPFGPKNTPTILPEIFGGTNGLLGGTARGQGVGQSPVGETRDRDKLGQSPVGETRDRDKLGKGIESALNKYTARLGKLQEQLQHAKESGDNRRTQNLRDRIERTNQRIDAAKQSLTSTTVQTRDAARHAGISTTSAENAGTRAIVAAIFAARPDISIFVSSANIEASMQSGNRSGPRNGSSGAPRRPGNGTGNGGGN